MRRVPPRSRLTRVCICPTGKGGLILVSFFFDGLVVAKEKKKKKMKMKMIFL